MRSIPQTHPRKCTSEGEMSSNTDEYGATTTKKSQISGRNASRSSHDDGVFEHNTVETRKANRCLLLSCPHPSFCSIIWEASFVWQLDDSVCILQISRCAQCFNLHNGVIVEVHMISQSEFLVLRTLKEIEGLTNPIHLEGTVEIVSQGSLCRYVGLLSFQWVISPLCGSVQ